MAAGDLTTLDDVKAWLGLDSGQADDDALLLGLISAASGFIKAWLNRDLLSQPYNETRDGVGGVRIPFRNTPVTAVASLSIDGNPIPASSGPGQPGYYFTAKMLMLAGGYAFNRGFGNVALAYTAGYATVPPEIAQACVELVGLRYRERDRIGEVSKNLAGQVVAFSQKDMPAWVATTLQQYRRVVPL